MKTRLQALWLVLTSKNYVVICADEYLFTKVRYHGIKNSLYKMLDYAIHMYGPLLKDNTEKI